MGADNVGMPKVCRREQDPEFCAQVAQVGEARRANMTPADHTAERDARDAMVMDAGWADHYGDTHPMNAQNFIISDWIKFVNSGQGRNQDMTPNGKRDRQFRGNAGYCRFYAPYQDARDEACVAGAGGRDADAAGYQAMMDHYGVPAPFWAWW